MKLAFRVFLGAMICPILVFGQSREAANLMRTDSTWKREQFQFPLSFAAQIPLLGKEEACFPPGWANKSSPEFWSYVFVWAVKTEVPVTEKELKNYLKIYFDGLMGVQHTKVKLRSQKGRPGTQAIYTGEVKTTDAFFSKKPMVLFVQVENQFCERTKQSYISFRFSPKALGQPIWKVLHAVELVEVCVD